MRRIIGSIVGVGLLVGLAAAAPGAGALGRSQPAASSVPVGLKGIRNLTSAEKARWERLVAAAQQDGKLVVVASSDQTAAFYQAFGQEFGINVSVSTGSPTLIVTRILAERQQGLHLEDILDAGTNTAVSLLQASVFQPIIPNIVIPSDLNRSTGWYLNRIPWSPGDPVKKYCTYATMTPSANLTFFYNTSMLLPDQIAKIKSWNDLLSPQFRGKWEMGNVADGVASNDRTLGWALLGKKYWEKFMANSPTVFPVGQDPLAVNALLRGQFEFAIFPGAGSPWHGAIGQGLNIAEFTKILKPRAPAVLGASLCMFNNAPNQAAAQLFANWILTPEGQAALNQYQTVPGDVALRKTAPRGTTPADVWLAARHTKGVFVASNHPKDVNDSLTWWQAEMTKLGIH